MGTNHNLKRYHQSIDHWSLYLRAINEICSGEISRKERLRKKFSPQKNRVAMEWFLLGCFAAASPAAGAANEWQSVLRFWFSIPYLFSRSLAIPISANIGRPKVIQKKYRI